MTKDSHSQPDDNGRQGMTDRYQGRHGGTEYQEAEVEEEISPTCVCPKCGYSVPSDDESPCTQQACPKCGSILGEFTGTP